MTQLLTLATDGRGVVPMPIALKPEAFADVCRWIVLTHEGDEAHRMLDRVVTALLTSLGYGDGMDIFLAAVTPCHPKEP